MFVGELLELEEGVEHETLCVSREPHEHENKNDPCPRVRVQTELDSRSGSNRDLFTYSENLALGELSLLDEYTELRHILVQPLGELVAGQRGTIALECLAQGGYQVCGFIGGFCFRLRLGRGHGDHGEGTTDAGRSLRALVWPPPGFPRLLRLRYLLLRRVGAACRVG